MANTTAVYARIDTTLKENAESILSQLGITPSSAIQMLYSQIVLLNGMPFMSDEEINKELEKARQSIENDRCYSVEEVDEELAKEFGI